MDELESSDYLQFISGLITEAEEDKQEWLDLSPEAREAIVQGVAYQEWPRRSDCEFLATTREVLLNDQPVAVSVLKRVFEGASELASLNEIIDRDLADLPKIERQLASMRSNGIG